MVNTDIGIKTKEDLILTLKGLRKISGLVTSPKSFKEYIVALALNSSPLDEGGFFHIPNQEPNTVYKIDSWNKGITTLATLEFLARVLQVLPQDPFQFQPIEMYWATKDIIYMEKAETKTPTKEDETRVQKGKELIRRLVGITGIEPPFNNDILFRGFNSEGKPVLSLVDLNDPLILHTDMSFKPAPIVIK